MHMSFWWSSNVSDYLFYGLSTHSAGGLFGLCLCVAAMAFIFEFFRFLQAKQRQKELRLRSQQLKTICPSDTSTLLPRGDRTKDIHITKFDRALLCGGDASIWFALHNLGYILMLSVMLYNGWFLVSAVLGGGIGYFVFGQKFMKINLQNCQIIRDTFCMQKCGEADPVPDPDSDPET